MCITANYQTTISACTKSLLLYVSVQFAVTLCVLCVLCFVLIFVGLLLLACYSCMYNARLSLDYMPIYTVF